MAEAIGWPYDAPHEAIQTAAVADADAGTPDILMVPS